MRETAWAGHVYLSDKLAAQLIEEARRGQCLHLPWGAQRLRLLPVKENLWAYRWLIANGYLRWSGG